MSEFRKRVMSNQLSREEAVPSKEARTIVWDCVRLLAFLGLVLGMICLGLMSMWVSALGFVVSYLVAAKLYASVRERFGGPNFLAALQWLYQGVGGQLQQWWYRNFLGCYALHGLGQNGEICSVYGRKHRANSSESLVLCRLTVAVRLGGWWRPKRVAVVRNISQCLPPWKMKRADDEWELLRITDKKSPVRERGRIYLTVEQFLMAVHQGKLYWGVRAATWHKELFSGLGKSELTRKALEILVADMIEQIKDTTRFFHSVEAKEIRLNALRKLSQILPADDPQQRSIAEQIPEAEADLKVAREKAAKGKKGSGVTVRKGLCEESR